VPVSAAKNIETLTHVLPGTTIIFSGQRVKILNSPVKYRTPGNPSNYYSRRYHLL